MALKAVLGFNAGFCQLGRRDCSGNGRHGSSSYSSSSSLSWRLEASKVEKSDDKNVQSFSASLEVEEKNGNGGGTSEIKKWSRDLTNRPSGFLFLVVIIFTFLAVVADFRSCAILVVFFIQT